MTRTAWQLDLLVGETWEPQVRFPSWLAAFALAEQLVIERGGQLVAAVERGDRRWLWPTGGVRLQRVEVAL